MSDTPRLNAVITAIWDRYGTVSVRNAPRELFDLARELETELAAAQAALAALREALNEIACWDDGPTVGSHFDEPGAAQVARDALARTEVRP